MRKIACYKPLKAVKYTNQKTKEVKIEFVQEYDLNVKPKKDETFEHVEIPCRQCIGCRIDKREDWTVRLCLEAKQWKYNWFVTLTYNEENLPIIYDIDEEEGDATLRKKEASDFIKRLRRHYEYHYKWKNIRFFISGEYGSKTERPHYHLIIFNCPLEDKYYWRTDKAGHEIFRSPLLEKLWNKGNIELSEFSEGTAKYVAGYVLKKIYSVNGVKPEYLYNSIGIEPEFINMSRKPGIGLQEFSEDIYTHTKIPIADENGKIKEYKVPYRFDQKLKESNPELYEGIKKERKERACRNNYKELVQTDRTKTQILEAKETNLKQKIERKRDII